MEKIIVQNLFKIFGSNPERGIRLLAEGQTKASIFESTGLTVGVNNANLTVNQGEIFVIMGLSGSGKSTMVRMLNRLIDPSAGDVIVDGQNVTRMKPDELVKFRLHNMSMVFQSFALMPHMTVLENTAFGLKLAKEPKEQCRKRALAALEQVGLAGWENSYPSQLSGGMQQRVGLARGLAVDPSILLMDEAFSALDPLIRTEMQDELLRLQEEHQRTIVFISHDLDEALRIGDRIAIMEGGNVVQIGSPEDILQFPANDYVRAFFKGVDPTNVLSAGDIVMDNHPTMLKTKKGSVRAAHELLSNQDSNYLYILDAKHQFLGVVSAESLQQTMENGVSDSPIDQAFIENARVVQMGDSMQEILPYVASNAWPVPVIDERGVYRGVVSKNRFLKTLHRAEVAAENISQRVENEADTN